LSHSIEAHNQLKLLTSLGYEVVDLGGYIEPARPHDPKRPALSEVPFFPEVKAAVDAMGTTDNIGAAQSHPPKALLDWLGPDGIWIQHHLMGRLWSNFELWEAKADRPHLRVVWRSVGQTDPTLEHTAGFFRDTYGLERVAYSPNEAAMPGGYAGHDVLIRFHADPAEWGGWTGDRAHVLNITQNLFRRGSATHSSFWSQATTGLSVRLVGEGSEVAGGAGILPFDEMKNELRIARVYLYLGTFAAPMTLGLIEALMTGIPVVSIGPGAWSCIPGWEGLFEGHELSSAWAEDPVEAGRLLRMYLDDDTFAAATSRGQRARAIETFGIETVGAAWKAFLG
jgi:glycosyltransferase involved in cell wall biosynthesis